MKEQAEFGNKGSWIYKQSDGYNSGSDKTQVNNGAK